MKLTAHNTGNFYSRILDCSCSRDAIKQSALLRHYFPCGDFISQVTDSKTSVPRIEWSLVKMGARSLHTSEFVCAN